jgi:hypothetical protein
MKTQDIYLAQLWTYITYIKGHKVTSMAKYHIVKVHNDIKVKLHSFSDYDTTWRKMGNIMFPLPLFLGNILLVPTGKVTGWVSRPSLGNEHHLSY